MPALSCHKEPAQDTQSPSSLWHKDRCLPCRERIYYRPGYISYLVALSSSSRGFGPAPTPTPAVWPGGRRAGWPTSTPGPTTSWLGCWSLSLGAWGLSHDTLTLSLCSCSYYALLESLPCRLTYSHLRFGRLSSLYFPRSLPECCKASSLVIKPDISHHSWPVLEIVITLSSSLAGVLMLTGLTRTCLSCFTVTCSVMAWRGGE